MIVSGDTGEDSCSTFPRGLRGAHPLAEFGTDHSLALPEGVPYPEHGWRWVPVCTELDALFHQGDP